MPFDLGSYMQVKDRILEWYRLFPDGRIVADPPAVVEINGVPHIASTARVYRTEDDPLPCQGSAWEPYPGTTPYTRGSEAQNAETSAVGRALGLAGIGIIDGLASRDEIVNRGAREMPPEEISADQYAHLLGLIHALPDEYQDRIRPLVKQGRKLDRLYASDFDEAVAFLELTEAEANGIEAPDAN